MELFFQEKLCEAGVDEAGRGALAGPVVAAAVILPPGFSLEGIDDSKKLSHSSRHTASERIKREALAWAIGSASPQEIDEINILQASFLAMHRALEGLEEKFDLILVDGNRFRSFQAIPHECFVKGDGRYASIAAASILAKTHRDAVMHGLGDLQPAYGWASNSGYPTLAHRKALQAHGITPHHRLTYAPVAAVLQNLFPQP